MRSAPVLGEAVPDLGGTVRVPGLEGPIEVFRDAIGVPHVRAGSTHDAFFAQGFVHAQDRFWQMEHDRRRADGRLAELLGPRAIVQDVFFRRMGLEASARADYDALPDEARAMLDAYAAGVNAGLDTTPSLSYELRLLDVTPEPWQPWHAGAVLKVRHVLMSTLDVKLWRARLLRVLGPEAPVSLGSAHGREDVVIVPPGGRAVWTAPDGAIDHGVLAMGAALADGSNNWALHGSRTASGLPLVAGDPHRTLEVPNVYYQNHVACPEFDAIGFSIPGVPGMTHFGHNARVAWCVTHAMADTQDLYVERFDPDGRYEADGEWRTPERRSETIVVRGATSVRVHVVVTRHGPVVLGDPASGTAIALRWTGTDRPNTTLGCVLPMLRATTVDEIDEAMRGWVDPCNSFVAADVDGTIGYLHRGRVPVRSRANGWTPVPGWTGDHEWEGDVGFGELPRLRNPEEGFIASANNRICGDDYPQYLGLDYSPNRIRRVVERIASLTSATARDMASVHADTISIPARSYVEAVAALGPLDGRAGLARDLLASWDGSMDPGAAAPCVYAALRERLTELVLGAEPFSGLVSTLYAEEPDPTPAHTRIRAVLPKLLDGRDDLLREGLELAVERLEEVLGPDPATWSWSRLHTTAIVHPLSEQFPEAAHTLDPPRVGCGGDGDTIRCSGNEVGFAAEHSSVARYVFDLADWERSGWIVPLGVSGHPGSPHYADQAEDWANARLHPMPYAWDGIEAQAPVRQRLDPYSSR